MKGMISMILIGALALTLSGCHAPVDAAATAPTRETTVPTAAEAQPGTEPAGIERPEPEDADFVRVRDYLPDVLQELPYAGTENFTGHRIYEFTEVFLRYGTVKKLQAVCAELAGQGLTLKIWRPVQALGGLPRRHLRGEPQPGLQRPQSGKHRGRDADGQPGERAGNAHGL